MTIRAAWWLTVGVGAWLGLGGAVARAQTRTTVIKEGDAPATHSTKMSGHAGSALASGAAAEAAVLAEQAMTKDGANGWAHYRRAAALSELHRTDEAVTEYKAAEHDFGDSDRRGRSLAIYGRAHALAEAGRCGEARPVFEEYARFVEKGDPKSADQARAYAQSCRAQQP
jgi:hypothetical protein